MGTANALDTTIEVVTPENIAFEYQLAGPFRRLPAYLIDVAVQFGLILSIGLILLLTGIVARFAIPPAFLIAAMLLIVFLISWFYGTLMETYFNGRTVGKWACGLRVICIDGRPIDGTRALLRNLLRMVDLFPPLYWAPTGLVGVVCMIRTRRLQRLGDLAAKTMVVIDEKSWRLPLTKVDDPRAAALASFIPGDYRVSRSMARTLATYVERRNYLTPARRREVARNLTDPLLQRFEFRPDIDPDLLMVALYYATFFADPRAPAPDLGPLAGHSPMLRTATGDQIPAPGRSAGSALRPAVARRAGAGPLRPAEAIAGAAAGQSPEPPIQASEAMVRPGEPQSQHDQPPSQHGQPPSQHGQPPSQHGQPPSQHGLDEPMHRAQGDDAEAAT